MIQTIVTYECPDCRSLDLLKNGHDYKGAQKFHCKACNRYSTLQAQQRLDEEVYSSKLAAPVIRSGDEKAVALDVAKADKFYHEDYCLPPCPVDVELNEGDTIKVGNLELETFETPGHCDGHLSFLMQGGDRTCLLGADLVFGVARYYGRTSLIAGLMLMQTVY